MADDAFQVLRVELGQAEVSDRTLMLKTGQVGQRVEVLIPTAVAVSARTQTSFVGSLQISWCPNEGGTFTLAEIRTGLCA